MVLHHHNKNKCKVLAQIAIRCGEHNLGMRWLMADIANTTFNEPKYMHCSPKLNMVLFSLLLCYPFIFVMFFFYQRRLFVSSLYTKVAGPLSCVRVVSLNFSILTWIQHVRYNTDNYKFNLVNKQFTNVGLGNVFS